MRQEKPTGIDFNVSVRIDLSKLDGWRQDQLFALFDGLASVIIANNVPMPNEQIVLVERTDGAVMDGQR